MRYVAYGWFPWGQPPQLSDAVDTYAPIFLRKLGTVPAGLVDIFDLCVIFVCFDDLRLPWGQSPQVLWGQSPQVLCPQVLWGQSPQVLWGQSPQVFEGIGIGKGPKEGCCHSGSGIV